MNEIKINLNTDTKAKKQNKEKKRSGNFKRNFLIFSFSFDKKNI